MGLRRRGCVCIGAAMRDILRSIPQVVSDSTDRDTGNRVSASLPTPSASRVGRVSPCGLIDPEAMSVRLRGKVSEGANSYLKSIVERDTMKARRYRPLSHASFRHLSLAE